MRSYGLLLALLGGCVLAGCGGGSQRPAPATGGQLPATSARTTVAPAPPDYAVRYPSTWQRRSEIPVSAYLGFLATGGSSSPGCPDPLLLVRRQPGAGADLAQSVAAYNRIEQLRRPARRVLAQRPVTIRGAREATLIEAQFPSAGSGGAIVHSYDLLARSTRGVAFHVFASGCTADLPPSFVGRFILSFDAATAQPGATAGAVEP